MKKLKNIMQKLSISLICTFALMIAVVACVFALPKTQTANAASDGNYGEITLNKTTADGYSYSLIIAGNGYTGTGFVTGSDVSIYVAVDNENTNGKTTFENGSANGNWNYMLSSLTINGQNVNPNQRIAVATNNVFNANAGAYQVNNNRYLVHTTTVNGPLSISAEFSFVERISVTGYHNNNHKSELDFVYNAMSGEDLSGIITGTTYKAVAGANHFDGFFDEQGSKLYDQEITRAASAAQESKTTSYSAQSYSTKEITIGTTTISPTANEIGGTAYVSTKYGFLGNTNTTTTKYFVSGETEAFVLFSGSHTFTAQAADGYTFLGWYNGTDITTATKIAEKTTIETTTETTIIAVFAKTYNITLETIGASVSGMPEVYYHGQSVNLEASASNNILNPTFLGWYKNGTKVENDKTYTFTVQENCTLSAIYSSAISLNINIDGEAQIAGNGSTTINLNQEFASALSVSFKNADETITTLTLANNGLIYSDGKLSCTVPAGEQITLSFSHGNNVNVSNISLSNLSIVFEQENGTTTATFNAIADKLTIAIPLVATTISTDFATYTTHTTTASTTSNVKNWTMFSVVPFSGYVLKDVKIGSTSVKEEYVGVLINSAKLTSLNQKLYGSIENKYLSQENLYQLLTTGQTTVGENEILLVVETERTNTITVTTTCESELLSTPYVGIVQNEDLVKTAQIANEEDFTISAQNTIQVGGTTYIFSHFLYNGAYLSGRANKNGKNLVTTESTTTLTLSATGSAEFCAVYRKANSISAQLKINSQVQSTTNAISATAFDGAAFDFALLPTNEQITITASYISASVSFSKFILTINGNTQEIKSSEFSLILAETDEVSLVAQYVANINYNPTDADFSTTLSTTQLTYSNETYLFGSTESAGEVSVSSATPAFGEQISFAATPNDNFVFVGWARINKDSTPTFDDITEFSSTFTTTADDSKCVVAVFASIIQVSVVSSSNNNITIKNTKSQQQTSNHMFTYAGAPLALSNNGANFIGYYNIANLSTRLSNGNSTYEFIPTESQNIVALFGNNTLNVNVATNYNAQIVAGGTFAIDFSDGRDAISSQKSSSQVFATQHGKNITLTATANDGYTFVGWFDATDTTFASPISTSNSYSVEQVGSRNIVAHFAQKVSTTTSITAGQGIISGLPQNVYMGQTITISASALIGYKFGSLTITNNGSPVAVSNNSATFVVAGDITIAASFETRPLISVGAFVMQPENCPIIIGGAVPSTITINSEITKNAYVDSGEAATITATVPEGYQFVDFLVNGIAQNAASTTLTLSNITANTAVVAVFQKLVSISTQVQTNPSNETGGTISVSQSLANGKGIVGSTYTFTAAANAGYEFSGFVIDGNFVPTASNESSITLCLADNDITVTAVFTKLITITTTITGSGSIKINGQTFTSGSTLPYGQVATIEFEPTSGYILTAVSGISITTNDGKSGFFTPTTALNISATYTQKSKLTLTTNNDSVKWDYNVPIIEVDYDNVVYGGASYNGPFGYTQILIGGSFVVPSGTNVTLTAPFTTDDGSKVFVGFFINGTTSFVGGSSYAYSNGKVTATYTLSENTTILARYEDATTIHIRSANGTTINTAKDKFSLAISGNPADYVISASELKEIYSDDDELINSYLTLTVPKTLPLTITANGITGWYFAANQSGQFYYNYNKVSSSASFNFIASELSGFASGYTLLAGYNASEIDSGTSASATLEQNNNGTATKTGNNIIAKADTNYYFAYWEVKIAVAASNLYIAIPGANEITATASGSILTITDASGTIYSGYAKAIRPVFKQGSAPATPQEIVPTTYSVEVSSAFGTANFTYNQVVAGSSTTITINGLTNGQYVSLSDSIRAYLTGFSVTGSTGTRSNNSYTITSVNANTIVVANFELRANVNGNWIALGSSQTTTAERQTTGASNVVSLFTGFTANALFKPSSASYSGGTTTFSYILTNSITTATATRSAIMVTISSNDSNTIYTPFGSTTTEINCYTDANGNIPLVALASDGYVFVSYSDNNGASKSTSAAAIININLSSTISSINALFAQKANLLLVSNAEETTATITAGTIAVGQTPTIEVSASGYSFKNWSAENGTKTGTTSTISDYSIPESSVITLNFAKQHTITTTASGSGSIAVSPALANGKGTQGTIYTFSALPADDSYIFTGWKVNYVLVSSNSTLSITLFGNTTITAVFESKNAITIPANSIYITSFGTVGQAIVGEDVSTNYDINLSQSETANVLVRAHYNKVLTTVSGKSQSEVLGKSGVFVAQTSTTITATEQSRNIPIVLATSNISDVVINISTNSTSTTLTYTLPEDAASSFEDADQNGLNRVLVFDGWYENGVQQSTDASYTYNTGSPVEARFVEYFRISKAATTNGTITINATQGDNPVAPMGQNSDFYPAGSSISVTADAAENYFAKLLQINSQIQQGSSVTLPTSIGAAFSLSNFTTISAEFKRLVTLTFNISDELNRSSVGGTISVISNSRPSTLIVSDITYDSSAITINVEEGSSVLVVFNPIQSNTLVEVEGKTLTGNTLTFTANNNETFNVVFTKTYSVNAASISLDELSLENHNPTIIQTNNSVRVSADIEITNEQDNYKLIAIAIVNDSGEVSYVYLSDLAKQDGKATYDFEITQNTNIVAVYGQKLEISASAKDTTETDIAGATITGLPETIYQNDTITLTAPEVANHTFIGWYLQNQNVLSLISTSTEYKFIAQQSINLVARYATKYVVNISVHKVTRENDASIDISTSVQDQAVGVVYGNGNYLSTEKPILYAHAADGYAFVGWYTAENDLVSNEATFKTTAQTASTIAKAVFEQVYSATITTNLNSTKVGATITTNLDSTKVGAIIHHNGTYAATTTDDQVAVYNLTNGSTILVRSQANGYTLATDMSAYETDDDGNYIVPIQGANISLVLNYVPSKNVLTVESSTNYVNTHTPTSEGSFTINGTPFDPQNPTTEFDRTKSFTFAITLPTITLPTLESYSYVAQIYKNGVLATTLNANGSYITELSSSATINVVFAELVNVSVTTTPGSDGTIYINGTQTTSASVPLGSTVTIYATNGTQYEFVKYKQDSTELTTLSTYTFTANESTTITAEFALKQIEFAIYFPVYVRKAIDSTGTAPTPVLKILSNLAEIAVVDTSFETATVGDIITIKVDGDYVIVSVPYGYNSSNITAKFEQATKRADITLNNTTISSANTIPATNNSFNILVGEAATTNKITMLSYTLYAIVTITSDGLVGTNTVTNITTGEQEIIVSQDSFTFDSKTNLITSNTDNVYTSQIKYGFFPVGTTYTLHATNNSKNYAKTISGSTICFDFDNYIVLDSENCANLLAYINSLTSGTFKDWITSDVRPNSQNWIDLITTINYTTLSSDKYLVTEDVTIVADYLNLDQIGNNYIFAVLNNNLTNGSFNHAQQSETTASHASTSVIYSIIPESQKASINVLAQQTNNFSAAGLTNNGNYDFENYSVMSGENDTIISIISKYAEIKASAYQTATKKVTTNSQTTYNVSLGYKNTNDYSTLPISVNYSQPTSQEQEGLGLTFIGYYIKATNFGANDVENTTTTFSIKPDNKQILDQNGQVVKDMQNYIKISDSANLSVVGPYEIVALFELNLYQINATQLTATKTTTTSTGTQEVKINDRIYIVEDGKISTYDNPTNLLKPIPTSTDLFQGLEKIEDGENTYYIVYTNETSHSGKIKGSLVFEHGDTANINAYVVMFGEFAGYQFANEITNPSQATITTPESEEQKTRTIENPNKAILQPKRNENNNTYSKQILSFVVTADQKLNVYFTGLRYKVTLQFVEYTNQANNNEIGTIDAKNQELALLFNTTTDQKETTNSIDSAFFNLSNVYNYVSYKTGMFNSLSENDRTIFSLKITSKDESVGEIVATPTIDGNKVSASFYVEAKAGYGFAGFNLEYINAKVAGNSYVISPEDNIQTQTYSFDGMNTVQSSGNEFIYNTTIDCKNNEELIQKMQQSLTLYLVQNCSAVDINVNNSTQSGGLRERAITGYKTYDSYGSGDEKGKTGKLYKTTNGVNLVVVKGANKFKTMLESYSSDGSLSNLDSMQFINGQNIYDLGSINITERELISLYAEALSIPYIEFIENTSESESIKGQTISAQNYFDFISSSVLEFSDLSGNVSYKIRDSKTGRYIELKLNGNNFQLKENSKITSQTDYSKWSDTADKENYKLEYNNDLITISYTKNSEPFKMSAPLIVSLNYKLTSTIGSKPVIGDDQRNIEVQLIKMPTDNEIADQAIPATQDDMVFAVTSINSVVVPEVVRQYVAHKDSNGFYTAINFICGGLKLLGGTTVLTSYPAHVSFVQTKLSFTGLKNNDNTNFVFANTGVGYIGDNLNNESYIDKNYTTLWDVISLGAITEQISEMAKIYADAYEANSKACYAGEESSVPLTLVSMLTIDSEIINHVTGNENSGQIKVSVNAGSENNKQKYNNSNWNYYDVSSTYEKGFVKFGVSNSDRSLTLIDFPFENRPFSDFSLGEAIGYTTFTVVERGIEIYFIGKTVVKGVAAIGSAVKGWATQAATAFKTGVKASIVFIGKTLVCIGKTVVSVILHPFKTFALFMKKVAVAAIKVAWPAIVASLIGNYVRDKAQSNTNIHITDAKETPQKYLNFLKVIGQYDEFLYGLMWE